MLCLPAEKESKKRSSEVQSLVSVVITIVNLPSTEGRQQQTMHHVTTAVTQLRLTSL